MLCPEPATMLTFPYGAERGVGRFRGDRMGLDIGAPDFCSAYL
jgi:hypothetical protein